jgi:hypothetical protein
LALSTTFEPNQSVDFSKAVSVAQFGLVTLVTKFTACDNTSPPKIETDGVSGIEPMAKSLAAGAPGQAS